MTIKVGNEYLEYNGELEIERKAKIFEEIDATQGDFSYSDVMPDTSKNRRIIQQWSINQGNKRIYRNIPAIIENNGLPIYYGYIRIERIINEIEFSFFSGNSNWFQMLKGDLKDIDFSEYDVDFNETNIIKSWDNTDGVIYPVINIGAMGSRSYSNWKVEDFHPFIYCHTVLKKIFADSNLKLSGGILNDPIFNKLITTNNDPSIQQIEFENRTVEVATSSYPTGASWDLMQWNSIIREGIHNNWNATNNSYEADIGMLVTLDFSLDGNTILVAEIKIEVDGVVIYEDAYAEDETEIHLKNIPLQQGQEIKIYTGAVDLPLNATLKITPTYIYKTFLNAFIPSISKQEFVTDFLKPFNTVISFDEFTKTVKIDLFKDVINNPEIDISSYVNPELEENFSDFISNYGQTSLFKWEESDVEDVERYNRANEYPYGSGHIIIDNDYIDQESDVLEMNAVSVIETLFNPIGGYLPELNYVEFDEESDVNVSDVTNNAGEAEIHASTSNLSVGDLVRIRESTVPSYNGDWVIKTIVSSTRFIAHGLYYTADANLILNKLNYDIQSNNDQIYLIAVPGVTINYFSRALSIYVEQTLVTEAATAYFYKPLQNLMIDELKLSLAFGRQNIDGAHQLTLIDNYWKEFASILQDPVKIIVEAYLPENVFNKIDFLRPIRLKTSKFDGKFYPNRITGYKGSHLPCEIELIKL